MNNHRLSGFRTAARSLFIATRGLLHATWWKCHLWMEISGFADCWAIFSVVRSFGPSSP